jgi:hydroxymethylbilane synthase
VFEPEEMLPAPVQGALAVECRAGEPALAALLGAVTDPASMAAVMAERSLLEALAADCSAPVAACASGAEELRMRAAVMSADGRRVLRAHGATPAARARQLGRDLAAQLLRSGRPISSASTGMAPVHQVRWAGYYLPLYGLGSGSAAR